jgi:hypothetical protein
MTNKLTPQEILALPIEELELGVRAYNILRRMGVDTIAQFQNVSANDLNRWTLAPNPAPGLPAALQIAAAQAYVTELLRIGACENCGDWTIHGAFVQVAGKAIETLGLSPGEFFLCPFCAKQAQVGR